MTTALPPKGMRDFLPAAVAARERAVATVKRVFESFGYAPLETPALERLDVLTGKYGEEADKLIFRILKRGEGAAREEADLGLRYDLTVPLARVIAAHRDLPRPFKRYQIQPVWRAEKPQKGRFREFVQCDVDCVGTPSMTADAEIIAITYETLAALGFEKFRISINHRKVLSAFIDAAGVPATLKYAAIRAIDKRDRVGRDGVTRELTKLGLADATVDELINILFERYARGDFEYYVEVAERTALKWPEARAGLAEMKELRRFVDAFGVPAKVTSYDLHMARGLDYYTGPIFETIIPEAGVGSVTGGGRYDHLISLLGGPDAPATGTTIGLERIIAVLEEKEDGVTPSGYADAMVATYDAATAEEAIRLARDLRAAGFKVEVYLDPQAKLAKQFSYADAKGIRFVAVVGPDEISDGTATVKDLKSRRQRTIPRAELIAYLSRELAAPPPEK